MNKLILLTSVVVFTMNISTGWAEKCIGSTGKTEVTKADCIICGSNCDWDIVNGKLLITGSGAMNDWTQQITSIPWAKSTYSSVEVGNGITTIGNHAFWTSKLTSIDIPDSVTTIGNSAFAESKLTSIDIPNSVTTIGESAFYHCNSLTSVTLSDSLTSLDSAFLNSTSFRTIIVPDTLETISGVGALGSSDNLQIICKGTDESCAAMAERLNLDNYSFRADYVPGKGVVLRYKDVASTMTLVDEAQCDGGYYWSGKGCHNKKNGIKCDENWKQNEDFCNRVRYTPAEAATVAKDDGNVVTITFKK